MKCKKARTEEGMMPIKSLCAGWKREIYLQTQNLFGAVHSCNEKETIFVIGKKINSMKTKSQDRRRNNVKRKKNAKTSTVKRCLSTTRDQALAY